MNKTKKYHLYALIFLTLNYGLSLFFFGDVVLKVHDNLEILPVYNHIISKMILGNFDAYKIFLSGEFEWYYLDRFFYPINLFHFIFNDKFFYFFEKISLIIIAYLSFFLFSKSYFKNSFFSSLGAIFYVTLTQVSSSYSPTFFLSFLPYILYLISIKKNLYFKHFIFIFFIGLHSSLAFDYLSFSAIFLFGLIIRKKELNYSQLFLLIFFFSLGAILSSVPNILSILGEPIHREEFKTIGETSFLTIFFNKFNFLANVFFLPLNLLKVLIFASFLFIKNKEIYITILSIIFLFALEIFFSSLLFKDLISNYFAFLRGLNFSRITNAYPFLISFLLVATLVFSINPKIKFIFKYLLVFSCFLLQIYYPTKEYAKEFIKTNLSENYLKVLKKNYSKNGMNIFFDLFDQISLKKNINFSVSTNLTFNSYYRFETYKKIKKIVGNSRVASIGIDPMIAAMNDIYVIDGYHTIYKLNYKKKFREIIKHELENNLTLKNYYDNWGNRVYIFYNDQNNLLIDFKAMKEIGAKFIISSFKIENEYVDPNYLFLDNDNNVFLYKLI